MTVQMSFEARLQEAFSEYLLGAPVQVDPQAMAASAAHANRRRRFRVSLPASRSRWLVPVLVGLVLLALTVCVAIVGAWLLRSEPRPLPYRGVFEPAGQMMEGRLSPMVLQLADGRVLIAGGFGDVVPAEIFDPVAGTSQLVDGPTPSGEYGSSVQLPDGKVLMIAFNSNYTDSRAWVFDPVTETFDEIEQPGPPNAPPFGVRPGVARLADGRVLVAGGTNDALAAKPSVLAGAMLFDPESARFAPAGSMTVPRVDHSTTALASGRVLLAGGWTVWPERAGISRYLPGQPTSSAEIFDPTTDTFTSIGSMPTVTGPNMAVALSDGRVLILSAPVERSNGLPPRPPVAMDMYDPATGKFSALAPLSRAIDDAVALRDGRVLLAGGGSGNSGRPFAAIYDPSDETLEDVPHRLAQNPGITTLSDGTVLFVGGWSYQPPGGDATWKSVEVFR